MTPRSARYILREHCIGGTEFLNLQVTTQMGVIKDVLTRQNVGPSMRDEFLRAAKIIQDEDRKNS